MYSKIRIRDKVGWSLNTFGVLAFYACICTPAFCMTLPDSTSIPSVEVITDKPSTKRNKSYTDNIGMAHGNDVNDIFKWIIVIFSVVLILLTISCALFRWLSNQETIFRSYGSEYSFFPPQRWKTMTPPPSYSELFPVQFTLSDTNGTGLGRLTIQPVPQPPISSTIQISNSEESTPSSGPGTTTTTTTTTTTSSSSSSSSSTNTSISTTTITITSNSTTTPTTTSLYSPVITNPTLTIWDQKTEKCSTSVFPAMKKDVPSLSDENNDLPSYEEALRMLSCETV